MTNVADLRPEQLIERYKSLAGIERGFKVLKSEIEIGPVYHRLPQRIRAHAMICFMALILHRVTRFRLREAKSSISPERAPLRQTSCRPDRIHPTGAMMEGRRGSIRTRIQRQSGG